MRDESIVLIEANALLREGLKRILIDGGFEILHSIGRIEDLPEDCAGTRGLKIVIRASDATRVSDSVRSVIERAEAAVVVVLGEKAGLDVTFEALQAGAHAYLDDVTDCEALYRSIELASAGRAVISLDANRARGGLVLAACKAAGAVGRVQAHVNGEASDTGAERVSNVMALPEKSVPVPAPAPEAVKRGDVHAEDCEGLDEDARGETAPSLSPRESAILDLLREGAPNKVIARRLSLTESTVKVHLKAILRKIRVKNRTQAAVWAIKRDESRSPKTSEKKRISHPSVSTLPQ